MTEVYGAGQKVLRQKRHPNTLKEIRVGGTHSRPILTLAVLGPETGGGVPRGVGVPRRPGTMGMWAPGLRAATTAPRAAATAPRAAATAPRDQVMLCGTNLWAMTLLIGTDKVTPL